MKHITKTVAEMVAQEDGDGACPLPLSVIPNHMGINLCSVDSVSWTKQDDGQLVSLTILFLPDTAAETASIQERMRRRLAEVGAKDCPQCEGSGCDACGYTGAVHVDDGRAWTGGAITIPTGDHVFDVDDP